MKQTSSFSAKLSLLTALILLCSHKTAHDVGNTELYDVLGVHFSVTEEEIHAKFKELQDNGRLTYR